ncbi:hypothetical protein HN460_02340 [bacterium]|jgi:phosphate/sulfate permease|nr:hypothetical protein [bacterium]MBT3795036.1 hypothetical protein [bacterium]MBT4634662.1 hypothetical protein [bacterium]
MEQLFDLSIWAIIGFMLASYSVIGNDSIQTLGTFIAANEKINWKWKFMFGALVFCTIVFFCWYTNNGDIAYGRLARIDYIEPRWYHVMAPAILLLLTRYGIPVSTTFLVFSVFASGFILEKIIVKSVMGYGVAAVTAYVLWLVISSYIDEKTDRVKQKNIRYWRVAQWVSSSYLWVTWLQHDMANIAVYLPRQISVEVLIFVLSVGVLILGVIFKSEGGRIQKIILTKTGARYLRSTTIIDLIYASILYFFKELNDLPMSTTWVFVGLLTGRELAISTMRKDYKFKYIFPIVAKDFGKIILGLGISIIAIILVQYLVEGGY